MQQLVLVPSPAAFVVTRFRAIIEPRALYDVDVVVVCSIAVVAIVDEIVAVDGSELCTSSSAMPVGVNCSAYIFDIHAHVWQYTIHDTQTRPQK